MRRQAANGHPSRSWAAIAIVAGSILTMLIASGALADVASARSAPRPDLRARLATPGLGELRGGQAFTLAPVTRNVGRRRAPRSAVGIYLSRDRRRDRRDVLIGRDAVGKVRSGSRAPTAVRARVGAKRTLRGRRYLLACADDRGRVRERREHNNCSVSQRVRIRVTTHELLAAAVRAGRLSRARALVYRVFAAYGDRRLPRPYRGDPEPASATTTAAEAVAAFGSLPRRAQEQIRPYLVPPPLRESMQRSRSRPAARHARLVRTKLPCGRKPPDTRPPGWLLIQAPESGVWIWWDDDSPNAARDRKDARRLRELVDTIWPKLTGLMGLPAPDNNVKCFSGLDEKLDIYLDEIPQDPKSKKINAGRFVRYACPTKPQPKPGFMVLDPSGRTGPIVAHELFHALQSAWPTKEGCRLPEWLTEGTATWGMDYVYPRTILSEYDRWLGGAHHVSLTKLVEPDDGYLAWPWWVSLTQDEACSQDSCRHAHQDLIPSLYKLLESQNALPATQAISGDPDPSDDLLSTWHRFARLGWNDQPIKTSFRSAAWGAYTTKPVPEKKTVNASLEGKPQRAIPLAGLPLHELSRGYELYKFKERKIRSIAIRNLPKGPGYRLLALIKLRNGDEREQRIEKEGISFCRDLPAEDVVSLGLIHSNGSVNSKVIGKDAHLELLDSCDPCREGEFKVIWKDGEDADPCREAQDGGGDDSPSGDIKEFELPTAQSSPIAITTGPDGALWFTEQGSGPGFGNRIGRITRDGAIQEFPIPTAASRPRNITAGPDGALWFTESNAKKIGRITTDGAISEFELSEELSEELYFGPEDITTGPDGALWFTVPGAGSACQCPDRIGRVTTGGAITEFLLPEEYAGVAGITPGPDGALWFTSTGDAGRLVSGRIGRITTDGNLTGFPVPPEQTAWSAPLDIVSGPDGALWFTDSSAGKIGRLTTGGAIRKFNVPRTSRTGTPYPFAITAGPDGALWFTERFDNQIGRITTGGAVSEVQLPRPRRYPSGIAVGPDGALWFAELGRNRIGRIPPLRRSPK
jgi:virginiamycin B lyase